MKRLTVSVLVALMLVVLTVDDVDCKKMTMDEAKKTIKGLRKTCSKKTGATKELLDGQFKGEFPNDERLMCYMNCILTMTKTIKNNEIQWDWFLTNARLMLVEEYIPRIEHAIEVCRSKVTAKEGCEIAWQFGMCVWETDSELYIAP